jgi:ribosomal-protein-alanine N-acetyltransferase
VNEGPAAPQGSPCARIETTRLVLIGPDPVQAGAAADFEQRNHALQAEWSPPPPGLFDPAWQRAQLERETDEWRAGRSWRWWLTETHAPGRIVGSVRFSQIARGPFCNAMLGYRIDAALEGRGLMCEALQAAIAEVFSPAVHLHRIQAIVRPENLRSLKLLDRLGFEREGLARDYLFIGGAWRDHLLTARRNPGFGGPPP